MSRDDGILDEVKLGKARQGKIRRDKEGDMSRMLLLGLFCRYTTCCEAITTILFLGLDDRLSGSQICLCLLVSQGLSSIPSLPPHEPIYEDDKHNDSIHGGYVVHICGTF